MKTEIYLIRHATPDWSRTDLRYDIPPGPPLTDQGRTEAIAAAEYLSEAAQVHKILTSPLDRTKQTATVIGEHLGVPVTIETTVAEWQRGEAENEVLERMTLLCEALAEADSAGSVVVVSHGGPIRMLLQYLGVSKEEIEFYRRQFDRNNPVPPAGIWRAVRTAPSVSWDVELVFTPAPHQTYALESTAETTTVNL